MTDTFDLKYCDHVGLWRDELRAWVPEQVFDAHVHIGPAEAVGPMSPERLKLALSTYMSLEWGTLRRIYSDVYAGKEITGLLAFGFPQREVDIDRANAYVVDLAKRDARIRPLFIAHPTDASASVAAFESAAAQAVRYAGAKPYADRLGKSNFDATMPEFIPEGLLELLDAEGLILMLHTSGVGMSEPGNQAYVRDIARRFARMRVVLAHMGRFTKPSQFPEFFDSGVLQDSPNVYLDTSSVSAPEVYALLLSDRDLWPRLLFASDMPFGLLAGVERWSDTMGAIFLCRDSYSWSDPEMERQFAEERARLTYNTYHCIKALKDAMQGLGLPADEEERLKRAVFLENALGLDATLQGE